MKPLYKLYLILVCILFVVGANFNGIVGNQSSINANGLFVEGSQVTTSLINPTPHHRNLHNHLLFEVEEDDKLSHLQKLVNCCKSFKLFSFEDVNCNVSLQVKNSFHSTLVEFFKLHEPPLFIFIRVLII